MSDVEESWPGAAETGSVGEPVGLQGTAPATCRAVCGALEDVCGQEPLYLLASDLAPRTDRSPAQVGRALAHLADQPERVRAVAAVDVPADVERWGRCRGETTRWRVIPR